MIEPCNEIKYTYVVGLYILFHLYCILFIYIHIIFILKSYLFYDKGTRKIWKGIISQC